MRKCIGFDFNRFLHSSRIEIWIRAKNVVHLQSIREMLCECGLRLSIARASSALRSPCTTLAMSIMRDKKAGGGHPM